jgi:hypothetical protein
MSKKIGKNMPPARKNKLFSAKKLLPALRVTLPALGIHVLIEHGMIKRF